MDSRGELSCLTKNILRIPYDMDFLLGIYIYMLEIVNYQPEKKSRSNDKFRMSISCPPEVVPNHERQLFER